MISRDLKHGASVKFLFMAALVLVLVLVLVPSSNLAVAQNTPTGSSSPAKPALDYEFYKTRVEPIFLKRRGDHARCYACHAESRNRLRLEKLSPGNTTWTEAESKRNFNAASHLVVPGDPLKSRLLMHPLAPEEGGDPTPMGVHYGGKQFPNQQDPDWLIWAEWVRGQKASGTPIP